MYRWQLKLKKSGRHQRGQGYRSRFACVDGLKEIELTEVRPDVVVREETVTVGLPAEDPKVGLHKSRERCDMRSSKILNLREILFLRLLSGFQKTS